MSSAFGYLYSFLKQPLKSLFWFSVMIFVFLPNQARNLVYKFNVHTVFRLKQTGYLLSIQYLDIHIFLSKPGNYYVGSEFGYSYFA
jgi:hypothetical protein